MPPTSRLSGFLKVAAKHTAQGAAVTLTSTVASCALACYIEIGAHRLVYHYFPHKYANVKHANGLTQEQLDAVRIFKTEDVAVTPQIQEEATTTAAVVETEKTPSSVESLQERNNRFWNDVTEKIEAVAAPEVVLPRQEILACAMTC